MFSSFLTISRDLSGSNDAFPAKRNKGLLGINLAIAVGTAIVGVSVASSAASAESFVLDGNKALNTNNNFSRFDGEPRMSIFDFNSNDPDQQFDRLPGSRGGTLLKHRSTGKCLNSHYLTNGGQVNVWSCNPADPDQNFNITALGGGYSQIQRTGTNLCIDSPTRNNSGTVYVWQCSGNANQKFKNGSTTISNPSPTGYYNSLASWTDTSWENAINSAAALNDINNNPNLDQSKVYRDLSNDLFGRFFPIGGAYISDDYYRATGGGYGFHGGIDISAVTNTPVKTLVAGKVVLIDMQYGLLTIQDASGNNHIYMHLSQVLVSKNQTVTAGQVVARTGSTGASSPHLHYEIARPAYPYGALQNPAARTKNDFRARTYNPLKDYWLMRRR